MSPARAPARSALVLIASDREWSARALESILEPNGYLVIRARSGPETLELARTAQPDAIVLDGHSANLDGLEICRRLHEDPEFTWATPILLMGAAAGTRADRVAALQTGVWELYTPPYDAEILLLHLAAFVRPRREIDHLREETLIDRLTGLYTARGLELRARELGAVAQRARGPLACVVFAANPRLPAARGRQAPGELSPRRIAEHLGHVWGRITRTSDALGRIGPREFGVIAPATDPKGAERLAERYREAIQAAPISAQGRDYTLEVRAGYYAVADLAESAVDPVEMLSRAASAARTALADTTGEAVIRDPESE